MFVFTLFIAVKAKTEVENPQISFGVNSINFKPLSKAVTLTELPNYLKSNNILTSEAADRLTKKMSFSTTASTTEHTFSLDINPLKPSSRTAVKYITKVSLKKSGTLINVEIKQLIADAYVNSEVITTTSKTFLWWEWDKQVEIKWRPLTAQELDQVYNFIDNKIKNSIYGDIF